MSVTLAAIAITSAIGAGVNWYYNNRANDRQDKQLDLQQQQMNESLRSNYYSYMQQLNSMQNELGQDQLAINQQRENIASNQNYLDRWANEYDLSMQNGIDEAFGQYQQMAQNYSAGLVSNAETGRRGGSAGRMADDAGMSLGAMNGGDLSRMNLTGGRLGSFLQASAIDMLSDRQTALSSLGTSYKAIGSYQSAMESLQGSISGMTDTTNQMKKELEGKGLTV